MASSTKSFAENAEKALADAELQRALLNVKRGFIVKRESAIDKLPEFDQLRAEARAIKDHTLSYLDLYLQAYEAKVIESGGKVHFASTAEQACDVVLGICRAADAKRVTKGKSMVSEEIGLNAHLQAAGIEATETDLGEYILQIRGESPSHIIAPVVHLNKEAIEADFRRTHRKLPPMRKLKAVADLVAEARAVLREKFLVADVGITGANLLIAETGTSVIVTNEGNGDLTSTLPRIHVVIASIEKLVPTLEDASTILRLLSRSATGQDIADLYDLRHRRPPRRRSRRTGGISRRPARQRTERDAGQRFPGHAPLHPLRSLPQSLPGVWRDRRPRLQLGLPGTDGRGADAGAARHRSRPRPPQRIELLRALRGGLPDGHPAAEDDARLARARLRARQPAAPRAAVAQVLGVRCTATAPLSCAVRSADAASRPARRKTGTPRQPSTRIVVDGDARLPGATGQDLPSTLRQDEVERAAMSEDIASAAARTKIFARIHAALDVDPEDPSGHAVVADRLRRHPSGTVPASARLYGEQAIGQFSTSIAKQGADVSRAATPKQVMGAIGSYLGANNLPPRLRMGTDKVLAALPWREAWDIERAFGPAEPADKTSLSRAIVGAAETGTLFLVSGKDNPTTLAFLPETHMVLIAASDIFGSYEEAWRRLREDYGDGALPRSVNLISGPSRTADIEQTIVRGAHGPRRLHVLILG